MHNVFSNKDPKMAMGKTAQDFPDSPVTLKSLSVLRYEKRNFKQHNIIMPNAGHLEEIKSTLVKVGKRAKTAMAVTEIVKIVKIDIQELLSIDDILMRRLL